MGLIPRQATATRGKRVTVPERQLNFRLDGRRRVKEMLASLPVQAAESGTAPGICSKKYHSAPSTRLGGYASGLQGDWKPDLSPGYLQGNARVSGSRGQ